MLDVGYSDKAPLVFLYICKSVRGRTDFNVFRCVNACNIHMITYVIEARLRTLPVLHRVTLQHKRIRIFYYSLVINVLLNVRSLIRYLYLLLQHNCSHWPLIGKVRTSIVTWSSDVEGGDFSQHFVVSTASCNSCIWALSLWGDELCKMKYMKFDVQKSTLYWIYPSITNKFSYKISLQYQQKHSSTIMYFNANYRIFPAAGKSNGRVYLK